MVTLIDYGVGNLNAFINVYKRLNIEIKIAKTVEDLDNVKKILLPGVGSFDNAMRCLNGSGMRERLDQLVVVEKVPVMGVCVGMQMMAYRSEEGTQEGLKWVDANVVKFDSAKIKHKTKIPHMGWNSVIITKPISLFSDLGAEPLFYFLHSYYFKCKDTENSVAVSEYGGQFSSAINCDNIYGIQFHPEKSHRHGEILLNNFAEL
ncbi:MAG TPA: imidazole glycerol phosphate synthase subunit HisH [Flavobacterium sp.]|nr:imidazole glycerol phosphate synthase subunit HisH [Flavobacterium sp.]